MQPDTLEIIVEWQGTVLDVRHLGAGEEFVLGRDLPHEGAEQLLAAVRNGQLCIRPPEGATAALLRGDDVLPARGVFRLTPGEKARVELGALVFYFAGVQAAERPQRTFFGTLLDREARQGLVAAFALHAAAILIGVAMPVQADGLNVLDPGLANRAWVEAALTPLEPEPPPPSEASAPQGDGGEAAQEGGDVPRAEEVAPPRVAVDKEATRRRAKAMARAVAAQATSALESELKHLDAIDASARDALEGTNLLAAAGSPDGLGGTAGKSRPGWGGEASETVNVAIPGVPRGYPAGTGRRPGGPKIPPKPMKVPKFVPKPPQVVGSLTKEQVQRVIRRHRNQVRYCYEKRLNSRRDLAGKVTLRFTIGGSGAVIAATVADSTVRDGELEGCLRKRLLRWVFPAPAGGNMVVVRYPFLFKQS